MTDPDAPDYLGLRPLARHFHKLRKPGVTPSETLDRLGVRALAGTWPKLRKRLRKLQLPLLISIPAVIFGIVVFWENHHEVFQPGSAYLNPNLATKSGYGIHVTLTNNGNPPVVIDGAKLDFGLKHNMPIYFYLSDPRAIDAYSTDPSRVSAESQALPISLDPHTAQTVVLLARPETLNNGKTKPPELALERGAFCTFIRDSKHHGERRLASAATPRPTLRLHLDWSGLVLSDAFPFLGAPATNSLKVSAAGRKLTQASWSAVLTGPPGTPTSVRFKHRLAEPSLGSLAKMTLYGHSDPNPIYELERPLVGHTPTAFRLPHLNKGSYLVAFSVDGDVVVTAHLRIRAHKPRPGYDLASPGPSGFCATPQARKAVKVYRASKH